MSVIELTEPISLDVIPLRKRMTIAEFLALPDDGVDRMLIEGELWETGMTARNRLHGKRAARITTKLTLWSDTQPFPRGEVTVGDTGFRLERTPESLVGPDVAYASPQLIAETPEESAFYDGPPVLAVEILSPSDRVEDIAIKVDKYLQVGTAVWEVNPRYQTVMVHRPGEVIAVYNRTHELIGDPYLPGFRVAVADFFAD